MKSICMCDEHKKMIADSSMDELMEMSNYQTNFMSQLDVLINGMDDPLWDIAALFIEWKGKPMSEIIENFHKVRENAMKIFDIVQEEIKKRLDNAPSHRQARTVTTKFTVINKTPLAHTTKKGITNEIS